MVEKIDKICGSIIFADLYRGRLYCHAAEMKLLEEARVNKQNIDKHFDLNLINECLENVDLGYNVLYYAIIYKEELIETIKEKVIMAVINHISDKKYNPLLQILMMRSKLTDAIVYKIIEVIHKNSSDTSLRVFGNMPFDYRYHILRREEISMELKDKVLSTYSDEEKREVLEDILMDIDFEISRNKIMSKMELEKYQDIADEIRAYQILRDDSKNDYKENKKFIKSE